MACRGTPSPLGSGFVTEIGPAECPSDRPGRRGTDGACEADVAQGYPLNAGHDDSPWLFELRPRWSRIPSNVPEEFSMPREKLVGQRIREEQSFYPDADYVVRSAKTAFERERDRLLRIFSEEEFSLIPRHCLAYPTGRCADRFLLRDQALEASSKSVFAQRVCEQTKSLLKSNGSLYLLRLGTNCRGNAQH